MCDRETDRNSTKGPSNSASRPTIGGYVPCVYTRDARTLGVYTNLRHSTRSLPRRRCYARNLAGTLPAHRNVNTLNLGALSNFKQRIAIVGSILGLADAGGR